MLAATPEPPYVAVIFTKPAPFNTLAPPAKRLREKSGVPLPLKKKRTKQTLTVPPRRRKTNQHIILTHQR